jgi:DnaJ-class molecular chaperone
MRKIILLILAGLYTLNPYDILPDFMIGWGWLDDLIIWGLLWRYLASQKKKFANYQRFYQHAERGYENESRSGTNGQHGWRSGEANSNTGTAWDPYYILEIDRSASAVEIKQAYRELALKYHPDKLEHLGDEFKELAEIRFKEIQKAYQELSGKGA